MANKTDTNRLSERWIDLAAEGLGGKVLFATDDFFAEKENLIKAGRGIFIADKYTDRGKWMDGWESRRKRTAGHDWCVVRLATPGSIHGLDIDTNHFLGNHPPFASVEGALLQEEPPADEAALARIDWQPVLPKSPLQPGSQHLFDLTHPAVYSHLRLNIFPDGGVARFKAYGEVWHDWSQLKTGQIIDLAAATLGAKAISCNDMFFSDMRNLLKPGRGINMGDGWETKRNRTPNNVDWVVIQLAAKGCIHKVMVDTCHFKGNYPDRCSIEGCNIDDTTPADWAAIDWQPLLPEVKLEADHEHFFESELLHQQAVSHVRFKIYPDGGVSRLRLFGTLSGH